MPNSRATPEIRVGIGGWTFEPWRESFYPPGLPRAQELAYASHRLSVIEVNGTFYRTQTPATFAKWASETPDGFVFALKAPRGATHRNDLTQSGPSVTRFLESGLQELGPKLGPVLWQFATTHKFDRDGFAAFADMLPEKIGGLPMRHVVEVAHPSYRDAAFVDLLRERGIALACIDDEGALGIADVTAPFTYARLKRGEDRNPLCYEEPHLHAWRDRVLAWAGGGVPGDLDLATPVPKKAAPRDGYVFFITGGKVRAPAAAQAFAEMLKAGG